MQHALLSSLEIENLILKDKLQTCSSETIKQIFDLKEIYDQRLKSMKSQIERLVNDRDEIKKKLQIEEKITNVVLLKYDRLDADCQQSKEKLIKLEKEATVLKCDYDLTQFSLERNRNEVPILRSYVQDLEKQINKVKKQLNIELIYRTKIEKDNDCLNRILKHQAQMNESQIQSIQTNHNYEEDQFLNKSDSIKQTLIDELERIKEETIKKVAEIEPKIEIIFQNEIKKISLKNDNEHKQERFMQEELNVLKDKLELSQNEFNFLKLKKLNYEKRVKSLESRIQTIEAGFMNDLNVKNIELVTLRKDLESLLLNFEDLHVAKIQTRKEIDSFYDYLHSKGIIFQFYNLRNGKKLRKS